MYSVRKQGEELFMEVSKEAFYRRMKTNKGKLSLKESFNLASGEPVAIGVDVFKIKTNRQAKINKLK